MTGQTESLSDAGRTFSNISVACAPGPRFVGIDLNDTSKERGDLLIQAMDEYGEALYAFLLKLSGSPTDAEDLSQALWLQLYKKVDPEKFHHSGYLYTVARNLFYDFCRHRKTRGFVVNTDKLPEVAVMPACEHSGSIEEDTRLFLSFWEGFPGIELTNHQKTVFWYYERYGYTIRETAEKVGIAPSTAQDWLALCKRRCLEYLNKEEEDARS